MKYHLWLVNYKFTTSPGTATYMEGYMTFPSANTGINLLTEINNRLGAIQHEGFPLLLICSVSDLGETVDPNN